MFLKFFGRCLGNFFADAAKMFFLLTWLGGGLGGLGNRAKKVPSFAPNNITRHYSNIRRLISVKTFDD